MYMYTVMDSELSALALTELSQGGGGGGDLFQNLTQFYVRNA